MTVMGPFVASMPALGIGYFARGAKQEAHIRALIVQAVTREGFVLRSLRSQDLDASSGLLEAIAELQRSGRDDVALEAVVSRQPRAERQLGHLEHPRASRSGTTRGVTHLWPGASP
jgi:hypothetical protein